MQNLTFKMGSNGLNTWTHCLSTITKWIHPSLGNISAVPLVFCGAIPQSNGHRLMACRIPHLYTIIDAAIGILVRRLAAKTLSFFSILQTACHRGRVMLRVPLFTRCSILFLIMILSLSSVLLRLPMILFLAFKALWFRYVHCLKQGCWLWISIQATAHNLREIRVALDDVPSGGAANFTAALATGFELLQRYNRTGLGCQCNQAIMLVTNGPPSSFPELFKQYNWPHHPVRVFTYLVGRDASNARDMSEMACTNKGSLKLKKKKILRHHNTLVKAFLRESSHHLMRLLLFSTIRKFWRDLWSCISMIIPSTGLPSTREDVPILCKAAAKVTTSSWHPFRHLFSIGEIIR